VGHEGAKNFFTDHRRPGYPPLAGSRCPGDVFHQLPLDWFTPLTGGGGGQASSAHYAVNFTIGQSAIGASASTNYKGCLGYWCGAVIPYRVFLPLVLRNF
jgi:hypothetical protein